MTTPTNKQGSATTLKNQQRTLAREDDNPGTEPLPQLDELLESLRQAQRHKRMLHGAADAAANDASPSSGNADSDGEFQTSAPTNPASQQFEDVSDNVIFLPSALAEPDEEDDGGWEPEHNYEEDDGGWEPEHDDEENDGGWEPQHDTPAADDIAASPAHYGAAEDDIAPQQDLGPGIAEQRAAENEQYLDRSVDPETLSIPLVVFPSLYKVIPTRESACAGWSAFIDAIAPKTPLIAKQKPDVPYVIAGPLQEAPLSKAAQEQLREAGINAATGKARSNKHIPSLGPGFLLDDDGDVFAREAVLRALGCAACIYTSYSYGTIKKGAAEPSKGGRVVLCLNRPYTPGENKPLWSGISHLLGGGFDEAGQTLSQSYGMHACRNADAQHKRLPLDGAALNVDALVALGRRLMPAKKAPAPAANHENPPRQGATIEQIRSAVEFLSGYLDEHPEVLADEPDWMNNIARPFAYQAWRCPDQREELGRLLDELSRKATGYDADENEQKFERYIAEARERAGGVGVDGPRTIASFFAWVKELGWKGYVPTDVAWDMPGYEATNRQLIQQQIIAEPELFSRNGLLVRLRVPETDEMVEGTEWKGDMPGTTMVKPADIMLCAERLVWMRNGKQGPYRVYPPRPFVGDYIQQVGGQGARSLRGLTRLPHIDDNGNVRCFSGYDRETGLYNDRPIHLDIPPTVSRDEARQLLDKLLYPFSQYTFKNPEQARATVLAAIFTILERPYLPLAPMFIFRSAMAGTGKGKLGRALTEVALATTPAKATWGGSPEEFERNSLRSFFKRLAQFLSTTPTA